MKLPRRRRLESKTDYKSRLALLKSEKPRLVVRKTNRYIIVQIVSSEIAQDKILVGKTSKKLHIRRDSTIRRPFSPFRGNLDTRL